MLFYSWADSPTQHLLQNVKKVLLHPTTTLKYLLMFKTSKLSMSWELNSLCKIIFVIFLGKFPVFSYWKMEHPNSLISLFSSWCVPPVIWSFCLKEEGAPSFLTSLSPPRDRDPLPTDTENNTFSHTMYFTHTSL